MTVCLYQPCPTGFRDQSAFTKTGTVLTTSPNINCSKRILLLEELRKIKNTLTSTGGREVRYWNSHYLADINSVTQYTGAV
jgi:hypothetical protein